ncbi:MAG: 50S ribosomal protein L3 [Candidatus Poribacteria bacterium]|nr:50S ribosomal protein L3 [Candidatus Poribacteria bacterium]MDE0504650.1 50S ribosomal protein L3 [Candidatus Poribacteria bacterium]
MLKGIIGKKVGMTQVFDESGNAFPVTVIEAGPCPIVQIKTESQDGYQAVQLGFGTRKQNKVNRPENGHIQKANVSPPRALREIRVDNADQLSVGSMIDSGIFSVGDYVDVTGTSKGLGFTGVVKRHGFSGGKKSHGGEQDLRRPGSIGASSYPSRVFKGKRMPGRHGGRRVTVQNLEVIQADAERSLLLVKGSVPGPANGLLLINKAVKAGD